MIPKERLASDRSVYICGKHRVLASSSGKCLVCEKKKEMEEKPLRDKIAALEEYALAMRNLAESRFERIAALEALLSTDTTEWKSAAFQKIKKLEARLGSFQELLEAARTALKELRPEMLRLAMPSSCGGSVPHCERIIDKAITKIEGGTK